MEEEKDYRTDSTYVPEYTYAMNPVHMRMCLLINGLDFPERPAGEPFRYLELGFGRGVTLNIHAAANDGEFWGADFLPQHVALAQKLADAAGSNCTLMNKSFAELDAMSADGKLPQFDAIVYHGVWSWINAGNRRHILNILDRNLKPGGVVYNSYNSMPGWAHVLPVREIMVSLLKRYGEGTDIHNNIREMVDYLIKFGETGESEFFNMNPESLKHLKHLRTYSPSYLAQEYFNATWQAFYFREVAADMAPIGCRFVTSTALIQQISGAVRPKIRKLFAQVPDPDIRQSLADFATGVQFRTDLFVRSPRFLNASEQMERFADAGLRMMLKRQDISLDVRCGYQVLCMDPELFNPLLDRLNAGGRTIKPVSEIIGDTGDQYEAMPVAMECLRVIIGSGMAIPVKRSVSPEVFERCRRLNRLLSRQLVDEGLLSAMYLASPVLGAGYKLTIDEVLALMAEPSDRSDIEAWARNVAMDVVRHQPGVSYPEVFEKMKREIETMRTEKGEDIDAYRISATGSQP